MDSGGRRVQEFKRTGLEIADVQTSIAKRIGAGFIGDQAHAGIGCEPPSIAPIFGIAGSNIGFYEVIVPAAFGDRNAKLAGEGTLLSVQGFFSDSLLSHRESRRHIPDALAMSHALCADCGLIQGYLSTREPKRQPPAR